MEQRDYRSSSDPAALAQHLLDTFDQDETVAQALEGDEGLIVQVGQRTGGFFSDEPHNALTVAIESLNDGLRVSMGEQQWYSAEGGQIMVGGLIGFFPFFFTWPLKGGRDESIDPQLTARVWQSIERYVEQTEGTVGATRNVPQPPQAATGSTTRLPHQPQAATGATTRLPSLHCPACGTANPPDAERCRECGTFLKAKDCPRCGVSNPATANFCMRCGMSLTPHQIAAG